MKVIQNCNSYACGWKDVTDSYEKNNKPINKNPLIFVTAIKGLITNQINTLRGNGGALL